MKEDFHDVLEITEAGSETHGDGPMKGRIIPETNDDKKGKVLYCQECNYQTPKLKPSKAKQKLNAHAFSRHKEDLPMDTREDLHNVLEMTKAGSEHANGSNIPETNDDTHVFAQHKEDLPMDTKEYLQEVEETNNTSLIEQNCWLKVLMMNMNLLDINKTYLRTLKRMFKRLRKLILTLRSIFNWLRKLVTHH